MILPPHLIENCSISQQIKLHGTFYELDLLNALLPYLNDDGVFLDIGAHIGNHTAFLLQKTQASAIVFEANPETYKILALNMLDLGLKDRVQEFCVAIGAKAGQGTLTAINPDDVGTMSLYGEATETASLTVDISTIDLALKDTKQRPITLMKIDAEGAEPDVIRGAIATIKNHRPVICAESRTVDEFKELASILIGLRYRPTSIHNATPTVIWEPEEKQLTLSLLQRDITQSYKYAIEMATLSNRLSAQLKRAAETKSVKKIESEDTDADSLKVLLDAETYKLISTMKQSDPKA